MQLGSVNWTESHRPTSLDELALSDENRRMLESFIEEGEIPHLFLFGPAGCGKTSVARILIRELDARHLTLNASADRGIDVIRDDVSEFVRARAFESWNIVFLDEADALTKDAQTALRNIIEEYADNARFILTGNRPSRIIDPIKSRCQSVRMSEIPEKQRLRILVDVLQEEGVKIEDTDAVKSYADRYSDLRKMLHAAQKSWLQHGAIRPVSENEVTGEDLIQYCKDGHYQALVEHSKNGQIEYEEAIRDMFWAVEDGFVKAATWRAVLGKAHREVRYAPDACVYFLGTCAELMTTN